MTLSEVRKFFVSRERYDLSVVYRKEIYDIAKL